MQTIHIIYVGTVKEKYLSDAIAEYEKRLSVYCKINKIKIKNECMSKEANNIILSIPQRSYKIALCVEGNQITSENFAKQIENLGSTGYSDICFIIGGSDGLDEKIKIACDQRLSISNMTFPHQLMQVILLEQIYRAFNIINGGKYHK